MALDSLIFFVSTLSDHSIALPPTPPAPFVRLWPDGASFT